MPQLSPLFFLNQVTYVFILVTLGIYVFSKYILPNYMTLFMCRISVLKL